MKALPQHRRKGPVDENVRQMDFDAGDSEGDLTHHPSTKRHLVADLNPFSSVYAKESESGHLTAPNRGQNKKNRLDKLQT